MQSNGAKNNVVDIPHFIKQAKERQEEREALEMDREIQLMRMLTRAYHVEMTRIVLDLLVLGCGVLILMALSK